MGRHKLTDEEKQNGKRKFLTPLSETLAESEFYPAELEDFTPGAPSIARLHA